MNTKLLLAATILAISATASAQTEFAPEVESLLVETCTYAQDDNRLALHKTLKANRLSKQTAVDKVVCEGQPLASFARTAKAAKVVAMLTPYENRSKGKVSISDVIAP